MQFFTNDLRTAIFTPPAILVFALFVIHVSYTAKIYIVVVDFPCVVQPVAFSCIRDMSIFWPPKCLVILLIISGVYKCCHIRRCNY